ncbi:MAG: C4-dicarboxylate ABC transporter [Meiothermus sp.]
MNFLLLISRAIDALNLNINRAVIWLVLLSTLVSAGNAVVRYALNTSSNAWLELQWFMFSGIFLLGAAYTLQKNGHVRVDVLYGRYPKRVQILVDLLGGLLFLIPMCIVIIITTLPWVSNSIRILEGSPNPGGLPWWPVKLLLPIAIFLLLLQGLSEIIKRIAMLTGHLEATQYITEEEAEVAELKAMVKPEDEP